MSKYLLANHVFICYCSNEAVLLDLKADRYVGLREATVRSLASLVEGWPESRGTAHQAARAETTAEDSRQLVNTLLGRGLLTTDARQGRAAIPDHPEDAATDLIDEDIDAAPTMRAHHVFNFFRAALVATVSLRWRPLDRVVERVQRRKRTQAAAQNADLESARSLVTIYQTLRPFVFTARDKCLFDGLAMVEFLSRYGLFPDWIFGVQAGPFAAHCWVQQRGVVFNDTADHVRSYTPIMVV